MCEGAGALDDLDGPTLREGLTIIVQDPSLYGGTYRYNLDMAGVHTDDEIWTALELTGMRDHIAALPGKLEAIVADSGSDLSGGQRQLLCLAKALLAKPKILILDEAASAVDSAADERLLSAIMTQFKHTTVLSIAHRLNSVPSSAHPGVQQASQKVMVEDNDLATDLEALREAFHIPGMAVGILHKDETVLLQGFGHSNEKGSRVDETTRFMLASLTKAFTSFAVGTMVSEGSLSWTAPIRRYRDVRFHDPVTTEKATLLDIMSHRTGLGTGYDAVRTWRNSSMALLEHLEALKPTKQFREEWQYSNLMFHLAGVIAGNASSQGTWEGLVQERILDPLDMSRTTVDFDVSRTGNAADGYYVYANGSRVEIPFEANRRSARTAPAGVIGSSAEDMVKWLRALLKKGIDATGKRMLDQTDFDMLHTPRMVMPGLPRFQEMGSSTYGLGWAISQYRGHRIVSHSGGWAGFTSYLVLFPDQELGAVILTNANNAGPAVLAACNTIADRILFPSAPPVPWVDRLLDIQDRMRKGAQAEYDARQAQRIPDTNPSRPLSAYAGTYTHDALGLVTVEIKGDQLAINSPMIGVWHATHWHYDSFNFQRIAPTYIPYEFDALLSDDGGREMLITFGVDPLTGKIAGLSNMDLERGLKEGVWFERIEQ